MVHVLTFICALIASEPPLASEIDQTGAPPPVVVHELPSYVVKAKGFSSEVNSFLSAIAVDVDRAYSALPGCFEGVAPIEMELAAGPKGEIWINVRAPYRYGYLKVSNLMGMRAFSTACVSALSMPAVVWIYKVVQRKEAPAPLRSALLAASVTVTFVSDRRDQLVFPVIWDVRGSYAGPTITLVSSKGAVKQVLSTNASSWHPGRTTFTMYPQGAVDVRGVLLDSEEVYRFLGTSGDESEIPRTDHSKHDEVGGRP